MRNQLQSTAHRTQDRVRSLQRLTGLGSRLWGSLRSRLGTLKSKTGNGKPPRSSSGTNALLIFAVLAAGLAAAPARASGPDVIYLLGTVRDFMNAHPDFYITNDTGHVANNIALHSPSNAPVFTGQSGLPGFEVAKQWRDKHNRNIAPHLFHNGGALQLAQCPTFAKTAAIDSYDPSLGAYGEIVNGVPNISPAPPYVCGPDLPSLPTINPPTGLPAFPGTSNGTVGKAASPGANIVFPGGMHVINSSFQCADLTGGANTVLVIQGHITIYATGSVKLGQNSQIRILAGSTLHFYFGTTSNPAFDLGKNSLINMMAPVDPDRCWLYNLGSGEIKFNQESSVSAHIVSPYGIVHMKQQDNFYGTLVGLGLEVDAGGGFHFSGVAGSVCGDSIQDSPGTHGSTSAGAISSAATFNHWFNDVLGVNLATAHVIPLSKQGDVYKYENPSFFPIDGLLFGNEGLDHNYGFTFTFSANFTYSQCNAAGSYFQFAGADDAWVYINGELVMDLGGVMPLVPQIVDMDRLGLNHGETYTLHFYYAQRNPFMSVFNVETNLELESVGTASITGQFD